MYKAALPIVQGIALQAAKPGQPSALQVVQNTYGMWDEALQYDPSGSLGRNIAQSAAISAIVGAAVGYLLPGFKPTEGIKWGALIGASRTLFVYFTARSPAPASIPPKAPVEQA